MAWRSIRGEGFRDRMGGRMRRLARLAVVLLASAVSTGAGGQPIRHRLQCPSTAPAEWGLGPSVPLARVSVLAQQTGRPIDESAPPSLHPDRSLVVGDVLHNIWVMDDEPGWYRFVDCQYRGSPRILRLWADGLKRCEQTVRPYAPRTGISETAAQTLECD